VSVLKSEIEASTHCHGMPVDTVYFGGGTPSLAGPDTIGQILSIIRSCFKLLPGAEISVECNPGDFSVPAACAFRDLGVNRLTLGIQTFSERLRGVIGRSAPAGNAELLAEFMSVDGIAHGIDIIAGIPGSTDEELDAELAPVAARKPEHVSAYMLSVEEGTPLAGRMILDAAAGEEQRRHFATAIATLTRAGYRHYEISNFCLPGFESRHNLKYWKFLPYLGFGVRAHSFVGGRRFYNAQSLEEYLAGPVRSEDVRTGNAAHAEFIMIALRLIDGFTDAEYEAALGAGMPDSVARSFEEQQRRGMIEIAAGGKSTAYRLTREGLFLADSVIYAAVESLL